MGRIEQSKVVSSGMDSTQISLGGFGEGVTAKELAEFLEAKVGLVWRCRLKTSWTPPYAYPKFNSPGIASDGLQRVHNISKVPPHAFVQFGVANAAKQACKLADRSQLVFNGHSLKAKVGMETSARIQRRRTTPPLRFPNALVELGSLVNLNEFWIAWRGPKFGAEFQVDPFDKKCRILLTQDQLFSLQDLRKETVIKCDFKMEFLLRDVRSVRVTNERAILVMLLQLWVPPLVYYRTADDDIYTGVPFALLDDEDPWIRTLDFTPNGAMGRCLAYRITLSPRMGHAVEKAREYLRDHRLLDEMAPRILTVKDEPKLQRNRFFFCLPNRGELAFETMFLVNALVHKGIVNCHRLCPEFFRLLRPSVTQTRVSSLALRHMLSYAAPVFDAASRLKAILRWVSNNPKLLNTTKINDDTIEVRRLVVTPTKAYCLPPDVELSNRVIRHFRRWADRFLRVTFMDDSMEAMSSALLLVPIAPIVKEVSSSSTASRTAIFRRVKGILHNGFQLCGRQYSFLAFSANQLRDRSAWFFAGEDGVIKAEHIRSWMGEFPKFNVAKHAARMGQCFSSTYCTVEVPPASVNFIPDIARNGYTFSDGVGKISPELAKEVVEKLQLSFDPPSAFQIRYGGYKGVVATWEEPESKFRLSLRPSMKKFDSGHRTLEVVSWTRFMPSFLNRQIITLLSSLSVSDTYFHRLQDSMTDKLSQMLERVEVAFEVLTTSCTGELQNTAAIMLIAGFEPRTEPHLKDMLSAIRAVQLEELLRKSRIFVPNGRWLMGCLDETGSLEYGQCFLRLSRPPFNGCFAKCRSSCREQNWDGIKITGKVVMAKNPCLHPGDIRVLEAVDVPGLHHLVDCLVFPQKGHRPHPDEASGSDLDGDIYFVSWDPCLIPPTGESWDPMDYGPSEVKVLKNAVTIEDIIEFFAQHMVNDSLGLICNAHVVHADQSDCGALDENCLKLAELAAMAVDFPKTGKLVVMPQHLRPRQYPDFMEKDEIVSYKSKKVLGTLYRKVKDMFGEEIEHKSQIEHDKLFESLPPYDTDLETEGFEKYIQEAWTYKCSYDQQFNALLGQFNVKKEGEVVTGHISSLSKHNSRRQGEIKERLQHSYRALRKEFRLIFEGKECQKTESCMQSIYEAKASAWYHVTYHPMWLQKAIEVKEPDSAPSSPLMSFPWIAVDFLAQIKARKLRPDADYSSEIRSLATSLVGKMKYKEMI